eukprot:2163315-Rhodomonas_salina.1
MQPEREAFAPINSSTAPINSSTAPINGGAETWGAIEVPTSGIECCPYRTIRCLSTASVHSTIR